MIRAGTCTCTVYAFVLSSVNHVLCNKCSFARSQYPRHCKCWFISSTGLSAANTSCTVHIEVILRRKTGQYTTRGTVGQIKMQHNGTTLWPRSSSSIDLSQKDDKSKLWLALQKTELWFKTDKFQSWVLFTLVWVYQMN